MWRLNEEFFPLLIFSSTKNFFRKKVKLFIYTVNIGKNKFFVKSFVQSLKCTFFN